MKIANAYGIKAANVSNYERLDEYKNWMLDDEPCLLNIMLTSGTLLIPKIKWETCTIKPDLDEEMQKKINALINA